MKKMFKYVGLAGVAGLLTLLFWTATPASAQDGPSLSLDPATVPAEVGPVDVVVSGSGFTDSTSSVFLALCPGVNGNIDTPITTANAQTACPTLLSVFFSGSVSVSGGSFSETVTFTLTQKMVDDGAVVITGGEAADVAGTQGVTVLLTIGEEEAAEEAPAEEETPAEPEPEPEPELSETGLESGLLAVIGGSVLLAGLLFAGFSRRIRK